MFSPNNAVACVDLSNYTEISTVILKPEEPPKSDQTFKPPPSGANVVMIIIPQSTPAPNGMNLMITSIVCVSCDLCCHVAMYLS